MPSIVETLGASAGAATAAMIEAKFSAQIINYLEPNIAYSIVSMLPYMTNPIAVAAGAAVGMYLAEPLVSWAVEKISNTEWATLAEVATVTALIGTGVVTYYMMSPSALISHTNPGLDEATHTLKPVGNNYNNVDTPFSSDVPRGEPFNEAAESFNEPANDHVNEVFGASVISSFSSFNEYQ